MKRSLIIFALAIGYYWAGAAAGAGFALAMVPVVFWPIGRRYSETLAMGYVVFRGALETVLYIVFALAWLLLVALSTQPDAAPLAGLS